jgi:cytoskeletal protein CcmA (bactofilin family)
MKSESALKDSLSLLSLSLQSKLSHGILINGTIKGRINTKKSVVINDCGSCFGSVKAKALHVSGLMFGNIEVDSLVIHCTGKVYCKNAKVKKVFIYNGGIYSINDEYSEADNNTGNLIQLPVMAETEKANGENESKLSSDKTADIESISVVKKNSKTDAILIDTASLKRQEKVKDRLLDDEAHDAITFVNSF